MNILDVKFISYFLNNKITCRFNSINAKIIMLITYIILEFNFKMYYF